MCDIIQPLHRKWNYLNIVKSKFLIVTASLVMEDTITAIQRND